jgi:diguanylate cyclase (GGDEF)-like protein
MDTNTDKLTRTAFMDMKEALRKAEERADIHMMAADTCALTGLLNRRGLERRTRNRDWGWFVAADLDDFKVAQDQPGRGHKYGDEVLIEFADFLMMNTRQRDMRARDLLAARTGGDEFGLWTETREGARRIKEAIREWTSKDGEVRASAGIGDTMESADGALYSNKLARKSA